MDGGEAPPYIPRELGHTSVAVDSGTTAARRAAGLMARTCGAKTLRITTPPRVIGQAEDCPDVVNVHRFAWRRLELSAARVARNDGHGSQ